MIVGLYLDQLLVDKKGSSRLLYYDLLISISLNFIIFNFILPLESDLNSIIASTERVNWGNIVIIAIIVFNDKRNHFVTFFGGNTMIEENSNLFRT